MDSHSEKQSAAERAAEVRSRRLRHLGETAGAHYNHSQRVVAEPDQLSLPVASSTLTSPSGSPQPSSGEAHSFLAPGAPAASSIPAAVANTPSGSETTAVVVLSGRAAQELLKSLRDNLSSSERAVVVCGPSDETESSIARQQTTEARIHQATDAYPESRSTCRTARKQSSWESLPSTSAGVGKENIHPIQSTTRIPNKRKAGGECRPTEESSTNKMQSRSFYSGPIIINSSDSSDENPDIASPKPPLKRQFNWREALPSTSSGLRNEPMPSTTLNKRKPGRPKGSRNRSTTQQEPGPVITDSSSDSDDGSSKPLKKQFKWRGSLPCSMSSGSSNQNMPTKRGPGRPKGSKNKSKSTRQEPTNLNLECHICRDGGQSGLCITDCGHLFHSVCLDRWISTSSQKYRSRKTCPYCGGVYVSTIKFYG